MRTIFFPAMTYVLFNLLACSEDIQTSIAKCEQDIYSKIGIKPVAEATDEYILVKGEMIRVCMLSKGRKLDTFRLADTLEIVRSDLTERFPKELVDRGVELGRAEYMTKPQFWK